MNFARSTAEFVAAALDTERKSRTNDAALGSRFGSAKSLESDLGVRLVVGTTESMIGAAGHHAKVFASGLIPDGSGIRGL